MQTEVCIGMHQYIQLGVSFDSRICKLYGFSIFDGSGSDMSASEDGVTGFVRVVFQRTVLGFVGSGVLKARAGFVQCLESLWTILLGAVLGYRVRGLDGPHG